MSVYDVIKMMAEKDVGALVALDGGTIVGVVIERAYARNVFLKGRGSPQTLVGEIMARNVTCVGSDTSIEEMRGDLAIMSVKRVRRPTVASSSNR
jgi:CBS domain-containing protein